MNKSIFFLIMGLFFAFSAFSQDAKTYVKEAKKLEKDANYISAIERCNKALSVEKDNIEALEIRANCFFATQDFANASQDYLKLTNLDPKTKEYKINLADANFNLKKYNDALLQINEVLEKNKNNLSALTIKTKVLYALENYAEAEESCKQGLIEDDDNSILLFYKSLIAIKLKKYTEAEEALLLLAKNEPNYPQVFTRLAEVRVGLGYFTKAIATADIAIKNQKDDIEAYLFKAKAHEGNNELTSSISTISSLINIMPENALAYYHRGIYYVKNKDNTNAKKDFSKAISLDKNYTDAYFERAKVYELENEIKLALNDYEKIKEINSTLPKHSKILETASLRVYEINKESNPPKIVLSEPMPDDKNFIHVVANQKKYTLKFSVNDENELSNITINGVKIRFDKKLKTQILTHELDLKTVEHFIIEAEDVYQNKKSETFFVKIKKIDPPKFQITQPYASSNGELYIDKDQTELYLEGKIEHTEKIEKITVQGIDASFLNEKLNPVFSIKINLGASSEFIVHVEDVYGTKAEKNFKVLRTEVSADNPMGNTWVVFIENSNYQNFSTLEGPTKDINLMKSALSQYSINKIIHKKDLTKTELEKFFSIELRDLIKKERVNSIMIWYSGHGKFVNETGYWIPVDAKRDEEYSYFNINSLRAFMQAYDKTLIHTLVVTDACESGPSFYMAMRDAPTERKCGEWEATKFKSAQVLSSAGLELASDNSEFTKTFSNMLIHNPEICIPIEKISTKVIETVSKSGNQKPQLGRIKGLEDQNGTFFFVKKTFSK